MSNTIKKMLAFLVIAAAVMLAMRITLTIKYNAIEEMYSSTQLEIKALEAEQYVNMIEYGIKYGKQLEYFFNMDELLENIYMSSSYMEGVYVISSAGELLFHVGDSTGSIPDVTKLQQSGNMYDSLQYGDYIYIYMDICDQNDVLQGKLLMKLDGATLQNVISREKAEAFQQSLVIGLEVCALAAVIIIASKMRRGKKWRMYFALLFSLCLILSQGIDCGIETLRISRTVESSAAQSTQKIAQIIQEQIDNVVSKGVSASELIDINSYLKKNVASCKTIQSLIINNEEKVQAEVSQDYINNTVNAFTSDVAKLMLGILIFCGLLNTAFWLIPQRDGEIREKKMELVGNNDSTTEKD